MSILVLQSSRWGKRELVALLCLSSWCLVIVVWLFLTMPRVCLQFVIVVFPDHTHLLFYSNVPEVFFFAKDYSPFELFGSNRGVHGTHLNDSARFFFCLSP